MIRIWLWCRFSDQKVSLLPEELDFARLRITRSPMLKQASFAGSRRA